jgi:hypothetical protein
MSALPPKADMCGATSDVRFGPKADITLLFRSHTRKRVSLALLGNARHLPRPVEICQHGC